MKEWDNWNPGYYDKWGIFYPYEKKWYCNTNKLIHSSKKEVLNCKYCNKSLEIKK
jgi:hypothetical protein